MDGMRQRGDTASRVKRGKDKGVRWGKTDIHRGGDRGETAGETERRRRKQKGRGRDAKREKQWERQRGDETLGKTPREME
jgi:hypothetical protein